MKKYSFYKVLMLILAVCMALLLAACNDKVTEMRPESIPASADTDDAESIEPEQDDSGDSGYGNVEDDAPFDFDSGGEWDLDKTAAWIDAMTDAERDELLDWLEETLTAEEHVQLDEMDWDEFINYVYINKIYNAFPGRAEMIS